jgi:hypothetical protein
MKRKKAVSCLRKREIEKEDIKEKDSLVIE